MILEGKLFLFYEQGNEGSVWAFQDNRFMSWEPPAFGVSSNDVVKDINNSARSGETSEAEVFLNGQWLSFPDPMTKDPDYIKSTLYCGEAGGDLSADKRLMIRYGLKIKYVKQQLDECYGENNWKWGGGSPHSILLADGTCVHIGLSPKSDPGRPYGIPQNGLTRVTVKWEDGEIEYHRKSDTLLVELWSYDGLHVLKNGDRLKVIHPTEKTIVWDGVIELKSFPVFTEHANGRWIHADQTGISRQEWSDFFFKKYPAQLQVSG